MIQITRGTVSTSLGLKTYKDKPFSLPEAEEKRLIERGVAAPVYLEPPPQAPSPDPNGYILQVDSVTFPAPGEDEEDDAPAEAAVRDLQSMKVDELKAMAQDMGISTSGLRRKDDYIAAITAAWEANSASSPELIVEEPVV